MLKPHHFLIALLLVLILPAAALADGFGFGWQYTGPVSGFSLKLPMDKYLMLQPMLSLSLQDKTSGNVGHASYGIRALMNLPVLGPIHPYLGVGLGRSTQYVEGQAQVNQGYQGFAGAEYAFGGLRPSVEIALGQMQHPDGSSFLGTMYNFGLHYYF